MENNNIDNCENCGIDIELGGDIVKIINDYLKLINLPQINGVTLEGNKTAEELGIKVENLIELIKELNTENVFNDNQSYDANVVNGIVKSFEEATNGIYKTIEEEKGKTTGLETSVANLESKNTELENSIKEVQDKSTELEGKVGTLENKEETDPTVPDFVKNITEEEIAKWSEVENKQDKLTAGDKIEIIDNVISATGVPRLVHIENGSSYTTEEPYFLNYQDYRVGDFILLDEATSITILEGKKGGAGLNPGLYVVTQIVAGSTGASRIFLSKQGGINYFELYVSGYFTLSKQTSIPPTEIALIDKENTFEKIQKMGIAPTEDNHITNKLYVDTQIANALGTIETELEEI